MDLTCTRRDRVALAALVTVLLGACSDSLAVCNQQAYSSVVVEVRDSVSGAPEALGALLIVRDGEYADSMRGRLSPAEDSVGGLFLSAAPERPGVYSVAVQRDGFVGWRQDNVRAGSDRCHVVPARVQARLIRAP
jgi:hypothetical protein